VKASVSNKSSYRHVQRAPLCLLLYVLAAAFLVSGLVLEFEPPISWLFPPIGWMMLVLAASFHHLTVEDQDDRLSVRFGPIPLFRRTIRYADIISVETGRTSVLDGWGIHLSLRGGWVWNLWGRDCVVLQLRNCILSVGTDDAENLANFLNQTISKPR
jgi:hypothetical protein